jgi:uncharacterized protein YcfL
METLRTMKTHRVTTPRLRTRLPAALAALALAAGAALLGGCYTPTVNSVDVTDGGSAKTTITDARLARAASLGRINKGKAGDRLRVTVDVTNTTDDSHTIQYRFAWLDANKFPIESATSVWQREYLQGRQTKTLDGTAPSADAADVKVELKLVDN